MIHVMIQQIQALLNQKGSNHPEVVRLVRQLEALGIKFDLNHQGNQVSDEITADLSLDDCIESVYQQANHQPLNVTWYVSAHIDYSPIAWFSDLHPKSIQVDTTDLFVFTCVDDVNYGDLYRTIKSDFVVGRKLNLSRIRDDLSTDVEVTITNKKSISIKRSQYPVTSIGAAFLGDPRSAHLSDGYLIDLALKDRVTHQTEHKKLLYLFIDNLCFLNFWMENHQWQEKLKLSHLVATCEGCALGGCKQSVFPYGLSKKQFEKNALFKPKLIVAEPNDNNFYFPIKDLNEHSHIKLNHVSDFWNSYVYTVDYK